MALSTVVVVICLALAVAGAMDFDYPAVFNFGDSNSDTGGLVSGVGKQLFPPYGQVHFGRPAGRFCDGRLIIDFLMDAMELPPLNTHLHSLGAPNFQSGSNFATAGSKILPAAANAVSPFSLGIHVAQFIHFKNRVIELLAQGNKMKKILPREEYFTQALYTFDIGQNDLAHGFDSNTEDQVLASIPTMLLEFETGIKIRAFSSLQFNKLYDQGARRFWIHNTGPLGCIPQKLDKFGKDPSQLDNLGCVTSHNHVARIFNLQLHALCAKLQGVLSGANVTYIDIFSIKTNLIANFSQYGFEYPTMACCGVGGPPLNYNSQIACGETKTLNGTEATVDAMELPLLNAYLDSVGAPNFQRGCNFAAAGSTILPATANAVSPFSFSVQVAQFMNFKSRVLELLAKGNKLKKIIPREEYFVQAL